MKNLAGKTIFRPVRGHDNGPAAEAVSGAALPGPLTSARFRVLSEKAASFMRLCPLAASCGASDGGFHCRSRVLLLRAREANPIDELQVARDLLREGLLVFSCRQTRPTSEARGAVRFLTHVCGKSNHPASAALFVTG
jgi:hypothetical protein